jgi:hypothetical protein
MECDWRGDGLRRREPNGTSRTRSRPCAGDPSSPSSKSCRESVLRRAHRKSAAAKIAEFDRAKNLDIVKPGYAD